MLTSLAKMLHSRPAHFIHLLQIAVSEIPFNLFLKYVYATLGANYDRLLNKKIYMPAYCFSSASLRLLSKMASRSQRRLVAAFILPDRDSLNKPCSDWTTKRNSALTGACHWSVPLLRHLLRSSGATSMPVQTEGPH